MDIEEKRLRGAKRKIQEAKKNIGKAKDDFNYVLDEKKEVQNKLQDLQDRSDMVIKEITDELENQGYERVRKVKGSRKSSYDGKQFYHLCFADKDDNIHLTKSGEETLCGSTAKTSEEGYWANSSQYRQNQCKKCREKSSNDL